MMEKEIKSARRAYNNYVLVNDSELDVRVKNYILERIKENKKEIEGLMKYLEREKTYEDIEKAIKDEIEKTCRYKRQVNLRKREDNFVEVMYETGIGIVALEAYDVEEVVRYIIRAIRTRNALIVSDVEYNEDDDKHLIMYIIKEAIKKFNISENIINIVPYEECDYEKCDKVIYTYENKVKNENIKRSSKLYIYVENEELRKEAQEEFEKEKNIGKDVEIITGKVEEVIEKVNNEKVEGTVIYTKSPKIGYRYINQVNAKNIFVNATLENMENVEESKDNMLIKKKIMYEMKDLLK